MPPVLLSLLLTFVPLSLASIGGGFTLIATVQRQTVLVHHWLTQTEFTHIFAVSRIAPGPGSLYVTLIGWQVDGFWGALAASIGIFGPTIIITYCVARIWKRYDGVAWLKMVDQGMRPVVSGMIFASAYVLLANLNGGWPARMIAFAATAVLFYTKINPLWLLPAGAGAFVIAQFILR